MLFMSFHLLQVFFQSARWLWIPKTGMVGTYVQVYTDKKHPIGVFKKEKKKNTDIYT